MVNVIIDNKMYKYCKKRYKQLKEISDVFPNSAREG